MEERAEPGFSITRLPCSGLPKEEGWLSGGKKGLPDRQTATASLQLCVLGRTVCKHGFVGTAAMPPRTG